MIILCGCEKSSIEALRRRRVAAVSGEAFVYISCFVVELFWGGGGLSCYHVKRSFSVCVCGRVYLLNKLNEESAVHLKSAYR